VKHDWAEITPGPAELRDLQVRELGLEEVGRWDAFVNRCPTATFFHLAGWREVLETVFKHRTRFLYAERHGEIVGVLPLAEVKSRVFGHSLVSLPFCVYGGVAASDLAAQAALVEAAEKLGHRFGVDYLELRHVEPFDLAWPRQDLYVTFRKPILADPDANMREIPRKQRAMVRKGIQAGLRSELDTGTSRFFQLYADNVHRHGTPPLPQRYFSALSRVFGSACEVLTVVDPGGTPLSSVLTFYFRDQVLPYYAGDVADARNVAANDFKYWELMRRACERGYRVFDYGRSKRGTGSFSFKKNWGFEPKTLNYEYRIWRGRDIPQHNPSNPKYKLFISMWRQLPIGIANRIGPYIVRNLG
jgi:FemAB-related protein (PEP-CTERM system-associated)